MKKTLIFLIIFTYISSFAQSKEKGLEYSLAVQINNSELKEKLMSNPEFEVSESFKVFYTENGVVRFIEKSNNFIQSSVFNNSKNQLTLFDLNGVLKEETGDFNKPEIKNIKSKSNNEIIFETKTGVYRYYFDLDRFQIDKEIVKDLAEHCLNVFVTKTGVLPLSFSCDIGIMEFSCDFKKEISLERSDIAMLSKLINNPTQARLSKFMVFAKEK